MFPLATKSQFWDQCLSCSHLSDRAYDIADHQLSRTTVDMLDQELGSKNAFWRGICRDVAETRNPSPSEESGGVCTLVIHACLSKNADDVTAM